MAYYERNKAVFSADVICMVLTISLLESMICEAYAKITRI